MEELPRKELQQWFSSVALTNNLRFLFPSALSSKFIFSISLNLNKKLIAFELKPPSTDNDVVVDLISNFMLQMYLRGDVSRVLFQVRIFAVVEAVESIRRPWNVRRLRRLLLFTFRIFNDAFLHALRQMASSLFPPTTAKLLKEKKKLHKKLL